MGSEVRSAGWETSLANILDAARSTPFEWGKHDCTLFALRCADAVWGTDVEAKHSGKYKTARGAAGRVKRLGGFSKALQNEGFARVPTLFAKRGDLAVVEQDGREALAVVVGGKVAAAGIDGLVFISLECVKGVWSK